MAKTDKILTLGSRKNKRQWRFTEEEFERFERLFEENELVDASELTGTWKVTVENALGQSSITEVRL